MLLYAILVILVVSAIITGIIVTIMDHKGFFPEEESSKKKNKKKKSSKTRNRGEDYTMSSGVLFVSSNDLNRDDSYNIPVIISSYTVDLSDVVEDIQKIDDMEKSTIIQEETVL